MPDATKKELTEKARRLRQLARQVEQAAGTKEDRHRESMAERSRAASAARREVGPIPGVVNPEQRERCRLSLKLFNETYLAETFRWPWSPDHLKAIGMIEACVFRGGQFAFAMPRGSGKSSLCEAAALWAIIYGHRLFVVLIGATAAGAGESIATIKGYLETNDAIAADFPEVCHCVRALDGANQRANMQTVGGVRTRMRWSDTHIVLPTISGSPSAGSRIVVTSKDGRIRGMKATTPSGDSIRPDLALVDDPQTDESAVSPIQNDKLEKLINRAVLGLAGPRTKIAVFIPCTVIAPGDAADRLLDRSLNPVWHGQRSRMLLSWPTDREKWDHYFELRRASQREGNRGEEANEYYLANREAMDAGAAVSWEARYFQDDGEVSAIQHAMNIVCDRGERAFAAEYQNDPIIEALMGNARQLDELDLLRKLNTLERGLVPRECNKLTAFIDIQAECLFWTVCAWTEKFGGGLVDYGVYPPQPAGVVFDAASPPVKLRDKYPRLERKARVYAALADLVPKIAGRAHSQDGTDGEVSISLCLIDAGFETEAVHEFISRSPLRPILKPSMGRAFKADNKPMRLYAKHPGDEVGHNWRIDAKIAGRGRYVMFDANAWKSFIAEAILAPAGATGAFYLPGKSLVERSS